MAIQVADNFQYLGQKPLDARVKYATVADMAAVAASNLYDGIMAYVVATEKNYQWKSTNTADPTLGKWREFQSGGGGASELANLDDVDLDDPADGEVLKYNATEEKWVNGEDIGGVGRAKSTAIAPVFDETATYAAGDRVTYEDELYVFNKAHTGAWVAADADKTDVDSEMPDKLTSQQMQEIKDAFSGMNKGAPLRMMHYSTEEQVVGTWIDGRPVYQKTTIVDSLSDQYVIASVPDSTVNDIISVTGFVVALDYNGFHLGYGVIASTRYGVYYNKDTKQLRYTAAADHTTLGRRGVFTVQYTKTTDTPQ